MFATLVVSYCVLYHLHMLLFMYLFYFFSYKRMTGEV
ncbi:unnamed protein product [Spirodela intermedia]|uniref:Uncharacterized protein n=1 Tax=Spirodela intermedia TaxID=51605 RepID=A0ABN7EAR6_SPIIN|nr:unnamed protein product [Spirodela intermedia]